MAKRGGWWGWRPLSKHETTALLTERGLVGRGDSYALVRRGSIVGSSDASVLRRLAK